VGRDGALYATSLGDGPRGQGWTIWRSLDHGRSWKDISDDAFVDAAARPQWLAVSSDNYLYLATLGNGVLVGTPRGELPAS
jgi:hypothetical protein